VTKDRAAPFSRKHRKYWITVTGGMLLIGLFNVVIGMCSYSPPSQEHERIHLDLIKHDAAIDAPNTIAPSQLPAEVMRAFAVKYPRTLPAGVSFVRGNYVIEFPPGAAKKQATFTPDGAFVGDE
jgi:hypothetical protein